MAKTLYWKNNCLYVLDQRLLPSRIKYIKCSNFKIAAGTIRNMAVRGAPAIGVCAGYAVALASRDKKFKNIKDMKNFLDKASVLISKTRPTAVNLFWAVNRMQEIYRSKSADVKKIPLLLLRKADNIYKEDIEANKKIGSFGSNLLKKNSNILTHCNAGALATAGYGTALGVIRSGYKRGKVKCVFVDETRPYLQGARLTAWEMKTERIPYVLITDNMAGHFMKLGDIDAVIVGADRIASNGDTANKIGTYSLSILAKHHKIPFYIAAPSSTIDAKIKSGKDIVIEERSSEEVIKINKKLIAPLGTKALHPAFDVTPAEFITAIITEKGVFKPSKILKALK